MDFDPWCSRTDGLFQIYGTPDGKSVERDPGADSYLSKIKKKVKTYSQIQKKKKKVKKTAKASSTFYEKVLAKTADQQVMKTYDENGQVIEEHYLIDPMNKTQNIKYISSQLPDRHLDTATKRYSAD